MRKFLIWFGIGAVALIDYAYGARPDEDVAARSKQLPKLPTWCRERRYRVQIPPIPPHSNPLNPL